MSVTPTACAEFPQPPSGTLKITLPGGAEISALPTLGPAVISTEFGQVMSLMGQLGPALAGIAPALKLIDAVTALFAVLEKAPEIPVDPAGFIEALGEAAEKIAALAPLVPQLSVPVMVLDSLRAVRSFARAIASQVTQLAEAQAKALALKVEATGDDPENPTDPELLAEAECALAQVEAMTAHVAASFGPLGSLLGLIGSFVDFLPGPLELPLVPDASGMALDELRDALDGVLLVLDRLPI